MLPCKCKRWNNASAGIRQWGRMPAAQTLCAQSGTSNSLPCRAGAAGQPFQSLLRACGTLTAVRHVTVQLQCTSCASMTPATTSLTLTTEEQMQSEGACENTPPSCKRQRSDSVEACKGSEQREHVR